MRDSEDVLPPEEWSEPIPSELPSRSGLPMDRFWQWMDAPASPGLAAMVRHLMTFWEARTSTNVILLHYDELKADLAGQMRQLAHRLAINVPEALWPELIQAATFDEMRGRADQLVPNATAALWHDNGRFFNKGTSGQWRALLSAEDLRRYRDRVAQLAVSGEFADWLHGGRAV